MSLSDQARAQSDAVNKLLKDPASPLRILRPDLSDWKEFRDSFWGQGSAPFHAGPVERGDNFVDDVHLLCDPLPPTRTVLTPPQTILEAWQLDCQRVLVRSEYRETEEAAISSCNEGRHDFTVTGHWPGIGASPSLSVTHRI